MEEKTNVNEKHLDYIQAVITRHNSNSFMIKGWAITLSTAVFAIAGTSKEPVLALVSLVPIIVFWFLDSFYLANERCFVSLYSAAINNYTLTKKNKDLLKDKQVKTEISTGVFDIDLEYDVEIKSSPYSMNFMPFRDIARNNIKDTFCSNSIRWYYLMLSFFSVVLFIGLLFVKKPVSNVPIKVTTYIENDTLRIESKTPYTIENNIVLNDSVIKTITSKK